MTQIWLSEFQKNTDLTCYRVLEVAGVQFKCVPRDQQCQLFVSQRQQKTRLQAGVCTMIDEQTYEFGLLNSVARVTLPKWVSQS